VVVCGARAEILTLEGSDVIELPHEDKKEGDGGDERGDEEIRNRNLLVPNIELATGCSSTYMPGGPPSTLAQSLSQRILSLLHVSRLVPIEDLRILGTSPNSSSGSDSDDEMDDSDSETSSLVNEKSTWELRGYYTLYIDILVLSLSGNPFDCAWLAVLAALQDTKLPRAYWDADREMVLCDDDMESARALRLRGMPVAVSWGVFEAEQGLVNQSLRKAEKEGAGKEPSKGESKGRKKYAGEKPGAPQTSWILVDPDAFEEGLCDEGGTVIVDLGSRTGLRGPDRDLRIVKMEKRGGGVVGPSDLGALVGVAGKRAKEWVGVLGREGGS
jgi:exosome complex component RRP43